MVEVYTQAQIPRSDRRVVHQFLLICYLLLVGRNTAIGQTAPLPDNPQPQSESSRPVPGPADNEGRYGKHHILWVIPNYRSDESASEFKPLTPRQKFKLAFDDSFDPTAFLVAGIFAGSSMAQHQYSSFGQGAEGFGK